MSKYYAGIGSRRTPSQILNLMSKVARKLDGLGFVLRSGGAIGADSAFESGSVHSQIFYARDCTPDALAMASRLHPAWNRCTDYARKLHGRNAMQILGVDLKSPVDFVICWTPDGCTSHQTRSIRTGGTGMAISIASLNGIQVFNLAVNSHLIRVSKFIDT